MERWARVLAGYGENSSSLWTWMKPPYLWNWSHFLLHSLTYAPHTMQIRAYHLQADVLVLKASLSLYCSLFPLCRPWSRTPPASSGQWYSSPNNVEILSGYFFNFHTLLLFWMLQDQILYSFAQSWRWCLWIALVTEECHENRLL